ncbi:unnamed protein product [Rhizoctonia solani]|uniref:Uncharacterized protein n=1 Tax=Rhizoctonia solani TaxID=456999 RepID=A0A8H3E477_9AGAM|nr:unnamed protein product [Rhizoctonia solani]
MKNRTSERSLGFRTLSPLVSSVRLGGFALLNVIGLQRHELIQMLLNRPSTIPLGLAPFIRSRPPDPEPEPYDVWMIRTNSELQLGFTSDFEQPEEEKVIQPMPRLAPSSLNKPLSFPTRPHSDLTTREKEKPRPWTRT